MSQVLSTSNPYQQLSHTVPACAVLCPPDSSVRVEVSDEKWRPLVVEVGAMGSVTGISKLAASVIAPLADRGVSVFCLSTNMDDYVMVSWCV